MCIPPLTAGDQPCERFGSALPLLETFAAGKARFGHYIYHKAEHLRRLGEPNASRSLCGEHHGSGNCFPESGPAAEFGDIPVQNCFRVPFASMVYVGDNAAKDFHAPRQLGMRWIFFRNNDGLYTKGAMSEPVEVSSVEELKLVLCDMI